MDHGSSNAPARTDPSTCVVRTQLITSGGVGYFSNGHGFSVASSLPRSSSMLLL